MKIILFDIDGTLLHTGGCGSNAFEKAFGELFGVPDSWRDMVPDGKTDPAIIEEISARILERPLSAVEYEKLCERYHFYFRLEIANPPHFRLMPGVRDLLEQLGKEPFLLGVATGNFEEAAWMKLERGGLKSYFKFGGFASDSADRTELTRKALLRGEKILGRAAERREVFLIGDTPLDVAVGRSLGLRTVGVATGRTLREEFLKLGADHAFTNLENTEEILKLLKGSGF